MTTETKHDDNDDTKVDDLPIDGGEPTDKEAELAAELDEHGDAPAPDKTDDDDVGADTDTDTGDEGEGGDDAGAPAPAPAPEAAAAQPEAAPADPKPEAPKDFDAEFAELKTKYDDGDLDDDEYQQKTRALSREEAKHSADLAVWEDRQTRRQSEQEDAFNKAALDWQGKHAEFLANPLHVKSMNDALAMVAQEKPELTAAELVAEAGRVTMEAYHYTDPTVADEKGHDKIAKATANRAPAADKVPPSVRSAPAAAQIDPGKSSYSQLDDMDISDLEDAVARLPQDKVEAFLADAPGANSRGN